MKFQLKIIKQATPGCLSRSVSRFSLKEEMFKIVWSYERIYILYEIIDIIKTIRNNLLCCVMIFLSHDCNR